MSASESTNKLNEKIQALSRALATVHTVHRLLTSTLNVEELLPRFARLCLQVLRSDLCVIFLLDPGQKNLIPRAYVNLNRPRRQKAFKTLPIGQGVEGKVAKTGNPYFQKNRLCVPLMDEDVLGVISIWYKRGRKPFSLDDREILMTLSEQAVVAFKNARLYEEQERLTKDSIQALAAILESKTEGGTRASELLVAVALGVASALHMDHEEKKMLHYAALLHDVGRIAIPQRILTKASRLTGAEYRLMRGIPKKSTQLIRPLRALEPVLPIILHYTERYDGKGYPKGLQEEEIPLGSRVLAVAKAFEAMVSHRPYRKRIGLRRALSELRRHRGKQFDPRVVDAFLALAKKKAFQARLRKF